ncbi:MAG: AgmX/PglI C-terminal domain-containing protein [Kofleriaceae bacterium]
MTRTLTSLVVPFALVVVAGCAGTPKPPRPAANTVTSAPVRAGNKPVKSEQQRHLKRPVASRAQLTPDRVISMIQTTYMPGIRRCYKNRLKKDPQARGKVTVVFTIDGTGRTSHREAKGFAGELDSCISSKMRRWRFPAATDVEGQATELSFMTTLHLAPD